MLGFLFSDTHCILYKGKKNGTFDDVWSYNGTVYAKMTNKDEKVIVHSVKNAQLFLQTAESRKAAREGISNTLRMKSISSILASDKPVSHLEEVDDLFNDVSSVGSSSQEDNIDATDNANVSGFTGDLVTWWDLSKAVFMY